MIKRLVPRKRANANDLFIHSLSGRESLQWAEKLNDEFWYIRKMKINAEALKHPFADWCAMCISSILHYSQSYCARLCIRSTHIEYLISKIVVRFFGACVTCMSIYGKHHEGTKPQSCVHLIKREYNAHETNHCFIFHMV